MIKRQGEVLFEWRSGKSKQLRLIQSWAPTYYSLFVVEELSKDALGREKWDAIQEIPADFAGTHWLHSFIDALRQRVWKK